MHPHKHKLKFKHGDKFLLMFVCDTCKLTIRMGRVSYQSLIQRKAKVIQRIVDGHSIYYVL